MGLSTPEVPASLPYPAPVELSGGVAVRIAALSLDPRGRLSEKLIASAAARAGLLVDLALAGRVESTEDSVLVDPTPTGFGPADRLLAAIGVEPERSLDGWLDEQRIRLRDVADGAVQAGRWAVIPRMLPGGHRYVDGAGEQTARDRTRPPFRVSDAWSAEDAAVTAIGLVAGLLAVPVEREVADPLLARTGSARWLCQAVTEHLAEARARDAWTASVLGSGGMGTF
jgi:hypothetical protein